MPWLLLIFFIKWKLCHNKDPANLLNWYPMSWNDTQFLLILWLHSNWGWNKGSRVKLTSKAGMTLLITLLNRYNLNQVY
jgi:hypothetical protein